MIKSQAQLAKANTDIKSFSDAIKNTPSSDNIEDIIQLDVWKSTLSELTEEVKEYKSWASGKSLQFTLKNLPKAVIAMRIANNMTQEDLALKLGVQPQQIQRYEKLEYRTASFERVIQIFRLLCTNVDILARPKSAKAKNSNRFSLNGKAENVKKAQAKMKQNGALMPFRLEKCIIQ